MEDACQASFQVVGAFLAEGASQEEEAFLDSSEEVVHLVHHEVHNLDQMVVYHMAQEDLSFQVVVLAFLVVDLAFRVVDHAFLEVVLCILLVVDHLGL